jgi:hypothetical protein
MKLTALAAGILMSVAANAQTVTFTSFGRPCGGDLNGSQVRTATGTTVRFDVTNAAPNSVAVLVLGHQSRPLPLPGSNCTLLVDPRATVLQQVDRTGAAAFRFQLPPIAPLSIDFQAVTIALNRNGRTAESTNGVNLAVSR